MKRKLLFGLFFCLSISFMFAKVGATVYASAKTVKLKSGTGYFARTVATVNYGEVLIVKAENGNWVQVAIKSKPSTVGWVSSSNITSKKITSSSSKTASASEIALAGKGFNQEVEDVYKQTGELNYDAVDKIEKIRVDPSELQKFIVKGKLNGGE